MGVLKFFKFCRASSNSVKPISSPSSSLEESGFFDCYALGKKVGRGAFGQVRIATPIASKENSSSTEDFAVKILDLRDKEAPDTLSRPLRKTASSESSLWLQVKSHKHVVRLQEVFYDEVFCYMVMEKCTSSLFAHLESMPELNEHSLGSILSQMLLGIEHVHAAGVVHRDVKPDNFLVGGKDCATVKLCDFGLSAALPTDGEARGLLKGLYGTAPFMCPEMIKGKDYDGRADVWSMGVLAYSLLFGTFPYSPKVPNSKAMKEAIAEGKPPSFEPIAPNIGQKRSDSAVKFVQTLLERSPDQRPSASDALRMPYMKAIRALENHPMDETGLPSLRAMLYTAKKAGVFELRNLAKELDIDPLLNKKQENHHGICLPGQIPEESILGKTRGCRPKEKRNDEDWQTTKSQNWQTTKSNISLNSKVWDTTTSFVTTTSANSSLRGTAVPSDCSFSQLSSTCSFSQLSSNCSSPTVSARTRSGLR